MGKILRDKEGKIVSVGGFPVLERTLERKPKNCQACGFTDWSRGDKVFIFQSENGIMEWLCPDCACHRGLPVAYYHRNINATIRPPSNLQMTTKTGYKVIDYVSSVCGGI